MRSMPDPTPESFRAFINKLVRGKMDDGQLDNTPLSLRDISRICDAFATVLNGAFHERIEYPTISPQAAAQVAAQEKALEQGEEAIEVEAVPEDQPEAETTAEEQNAQETAQTEEEGEEA